MPAGSGGASGSRVSTVTITPAQFRASRGTPIVLVPRVGTGAGLAVESVYFVFGTGFVAYGAAFGTELVVGSDLTAATSLLSANPTALSNALAGGATPDVVYVSYGGLMQQSWTGPLSLLNNAGFLLSATGVDPTGGAGNITAYTTYAVFSL